MLIVSAVISIVDILEGSESLRAQTLLRSFVLVGRHVAGVQLDVFVLYISSGLNFGPCTSTST